MMQDGTSLLRFKKAYIALLQRRAPNVIYGSPLTPEEMVGTDGSGVAAWWDDLTNATEGVVVFAGAANTWFDEIVVPKLCIQAIGLTTDDTQEVVDERATQLLGDAIGILAADPSVGLVDSGGIQLFTALPQGWACHTGVVGTGQRAARYDLDIELKARLELT